MSGKEISMHFIILNTNIYLSHLVTERFFPLKLYIKCTKRNFRFSILGTILNLKKETPVYMAMLSFFFFFFALLYSLICRLESMSVINFFFYHYTTFHIFLPISSADLLNSTILKCSITLMNNTS